MPIDASIYFQQQTPDFLGSFEKGMNLKSMLDARAQNQNELAKKKLVEDAYRQGIIKNADGTMGMDQQKTLSALADSGDSKEYLAAQDKFTANNLQQQKLRKEKHDELVNFLGSSYVAVKANPSLWPGLLDTAKKMGHDTSMFTNEWNPDNEQKLKLIFGQALSVKDQMEQQNKAKDFGLKEKEYDLKARETAVKERESTTKAKSGESLPIDKKHFVDTLATKNANKIAIKNQIDSVMGSWDSYPEDQKVAAGGQLLKTLNSPEGADAIGAEEARRLGSKLQFAMGNFTNGNPTQFGRDLDGFKVQAQNTAKSLGEAVDKNQSLIDEAMGRTSAPIKKQSTDEKKSAAPKQGAIEGGYVFLGGDPGDSKNWKKR